MTKKIELGFYELDGDKMEYLGSRGDIYIFFDVAGECSRDLEEDDIEGIVPWDTAKD